MSGVLVSGHGPHWGLPTRRGALYRDLRDSNQSKDLWRWKGNIVLVDTSTYLDKGPRREVRSQRRKNFTPIVTEVSRSLLQTFPVDPPTK